MSNKVNNGTIVVIRDDSVSILTSFLIKKGYLVTSFTDHHEALKWIKKNSVDLVITDIELKKSNGFDVLKEIKGFNTTIKVILIARRGDVKMAVKAIKCGAFDFFTEPLLPDDFLFTVKEAINKTEQREKNCEVKEIVDDQHLVGPSYQSQSIEKQIALVAPTDMSVIITGETGTGKEYAAKRIHKKSKRAQALFVAIDCGALPKELAGSELFGHVKGAFTSAYKDKTGSFEKASGGTLFLDEIGNLSYDNQIQLLRVLQEKVVKKVGADEEIPVDVRLIVATNENLDTLITRGAFRQDLFHRLNEFNIEIMPLRNRVSDIQTFAQHFLEKANKSLKKRVRGFSPEAITALVSYSWSGNLRELNNVIKRAVLICETENLDLKSLPCEISNVSLSEGSGQFYLKNQVPVTLKEIVEFSERNVILETLKLTNHNKTKTALLLDIDRKTLYNKMKMLDILD